MTNLKDQCRTLWEMGPFQSFEAQDMIQDMAKEYQADPLWARKALKMMTNDFVDDGGVRIGAIAIIDYISVNDQEFWKQLIEENPRQMIGWANWALDLGGDGGSAKKSLRLYMTGRELSCSKEMARRMFMNSLAQHLQSPDTKHEGRTLMEWIAQDLDLETETFEVDLDDIGVKQVPALGYFLMDMWSLPEEQSRSLFPKLIGYGAQVDHIVDTQMGPKTLLGALISRLNNKKKIDPDIKAVVELFIENGASWEKMDTLPGPGSEIIASHPLVRSHNTRLGLMKVAESARHGAQDKPRHIKPKI